MSSTVQKLPFGWVTALTHPNLLYVHAQQHVPDAASVGAQQHGEQALVAKLARDPSAALPHPGRDTPFMTAVYLDASPAVFAALLAAFPDAGNMKWT